MKTYTVKQLADLAGVSAKTLHHYDDIDLLKPSERSAKGYRLYGEAELFRLQQILLYKEVEMPLQEIKNILDDPSFDLTEALLKHKAALQGKQERYRELIQTIEKTIKRLQEDAEPVTDAELYAGFSVEQRERYDREAKEQYGKVYDEAQENIRSMSKGQWKDVQAEGDSINTELAKYIGTDPAQAEVQALIKRHHAWIEHFYPCSKERYQGLAKFYLDNPEFTEFYENIAPGLAEYISKAMIIYADRTLSKK